MIAEVTASLMKQLVLAYIQAYTECPIRLSCRMSVDCGRTASCGGACHESKNNIPLAPKLGRSGWWTRRASSKWRCDSRGHSWVSHRIAGGVKSCRAVFVAASYSCLETRSRYFHLTLTSHSHIPANASNFKYTRVCATSLRFTKPIYHM